MEDSKKSVACSSSVSAFLNDDFTLLKPGVNVTVPNPYSYRYTEPLPLKRPKYLHEKELATKYVTADCMCFYHQREEEAPHSEDSFTDADAWYLYI